MVDERPLAERVIESMNAGRYTPLPSEAMKDVERICGEWEAELAEAEESSDA